MFRRTWVLNSFNVRKSKSVTSHPWMFNVCECSVFSVWVQWGPGDLLFRDVVHGIFDMKFQGSLLDQCSQNYSIVILFHKSTHIQNAYKIDWVLVSEGGSAYSTFVFLCFFFCLYASPHSLKSSLANENFGFLLLFLSCHQTVVWFCAFQAKNLFLEIFSFKTWLHSFYY